MNTTRERALHDFIERLLQEPVEILELRAHALQSSCPLSEISLRTASGERCKWLLKDLAARSADAGPRFLYEPRREIAAYRVLGRAGLALPRLLGAHEDRELAVCWLLTEPIEGVPLWQTEQREDWCEAAAWLAKLHSLEEPSRGVSRRREGGCWLRYDAEYLALWMTRAREFAPDAGLARLERTHEAALALLARAPAVMLHGDYYPSNILAGARGVCPLDFELAGVGAAALDLAALLTGLREPLREAVLDAYRSRLGDDRAGEELEELLPCARLHLAIRWLGWMRSPRPPAHQRFDWVNEAHAAAGAVDAALTAGARG